MTGPTETRRIPSSLIHEAIERIVARAPEPRSEAARRFMANADAHGINPSLCWGSIKEDAHPRVRQVCLAVAGSGRTANLFLAPPLPDQPEGQQHAERVGVLECVARELGAAAGGLVRVIQSLPEPDEPWACMAFRDGGFTHCGRLSYLRLAMTRSHARGEDPPPATDGFTVENVGKMGKLADWRPLIERALDASYVDTMDCPELCGVRETSDVLDSHLATGVWDPSLWWILMHNGKPQGVALFNPLGDGVCAELVYVGVAPQVRGQGWGVRLLGMGVRACARKGLREMTCAVDKRNTAAIRLYARAGFREFASREAFVRAL